MKGPNKPKKKILPGLVAYLLFTDKTNLGAQFYHLSILSYDIALWCIFTQNPEIDVFI